MTTIKNNTSPTKVVSLRLPIEAHEKYASEASDLGVDLSPHLMEKLKEFEELQFMNKSLENSFFDVSDERDKFYEEQVKLKAEIKSIKLSVITLRNDNEIIKLDAKNQIQKSNAIAENNVKVITINTDNQLKLEKQKFIKSQMDFTALLENKEKLISEKDTKIETLNQEMVEFKKKSEEIVDTIIDKAYDYYIDAPMLSTYKWKSYEATLKKIYSEAFPEPKPLINRHYITDNII